MRELGNQFWNHKKDLVNSGELSPVTFVFYDRTIRLVVSHFGKGRLVADVGPDDFAELRVKMAKRLGPVALGNEIQRIRSVFKFALENGLVEKPVMFGAGFKRPSQKTKRQAKAKQGKKLFAPDEIRRMIDAASIPLRAMLLLAINAGFGNSDCANLPLAAVNLGRGWLDFPRPKTGVERRAPLWPETVQALRNAIDKRPEPKNAEHAGLLFITKRGLSWSKQTADNPVSKESRKLLDSLGINGHRGFYTLRHVFQTIGDEGKDSVAVRLIMGHADDSMSANYREDVSDARLLAVVEHVRNWLWRTAGKQV
jgi:integrase